jgi:hypothetical protein
VKYGKSQGYKNILGRLVMGKVKLDTYEQEILDAFEAGEFKSVMTSA